MKDIIIAYEDVARIVPTYYMRLYQQVVFNFNTHISGSNLHALRSAGRARSPSHIRPFPARKNTHLHFQLCLDLGPCVKTKVKVSVKRKMRKKLVRRMTHAAVMENVETIAKMLRL